MKLIVLHCVAATLNVLPLSDLMAYLSISFCIQGCICQFHSVFRGVSASFILYSGVYLSISFCIQGCICQFHSVFRGVAVNFILYSGVYLSISFCIQRCICQFHTVFSDLNNCSCICKPVNVLIQMEYSHTFHAVHHQSLTIE